MVIQILKEKERQLPKAGQDTLLELKVTYNSTEISQLLTLMTLYLSILEAEEEGLWEILMMVAVVGMTI